MRLFVHRDHRAPAAKAAAAVRACTHHSACPQRDCYCTDSNGEEKAPSRITVWLSGSARCAWNIDERAATGRRLWWQRWWPAVQLLNRNPISSAIDLITEAFCERADAIFFFLLPWWYICRPGRNAEACVIELIDNLKWAQHVKQKPTHTDRFAVCNYLPAVGGKLNHQRELMPQECNFKSALCICGEIEIKKREIELDGKVIAQRAVILICVHGSSAVWWPNLELLESTLAWSLLFGPKLPVAQQPDCKESKGFQARLACHCFRAASWGLLFTKTRPSRIYTERCDVADETFQSQSWVSVCVYSISLFFVCWCRDPVQPQGMKCVTCYYDAVVSVCARQNNAREALGRCHWKGEMTNIRRAHQLSGFFFSYQRARENNGSRATLSLAEKRVCWVENSLNSAVNNALQRFCRRWVRNFNTLENNFRCNLLSAAAAGPTFVFWEGLVADLTKKCAHVTISYEGSKFVLTYIKQFSLIHHYINCYIIL